jgi:hypothetical protein
MSNKNKPLVFVFDNTEDSAKVLNSKVQNEIKYPMLGFSRKNLQPEALLVFTNTEQMDDLIEKLNKLKKEHF